MNSFVEKAFEFISLYWWIPLAVLAFVCVTVIVYLIIRFLSYYRNIRLDDYLNNHPEEVEKLSAYKIRRGIIVPKNEPEETDEEDEEDEKEEETEEEDW